MFVLPHDDGYNRDVTRLFSIGKTRWNAFLVIHPDETSNQDQEIWQHPIQHHFWCKMLHDVYMLHVLLGI